MWGDVWKQFLEYFWKCSLCTADNTWFDWLNWWLFCTWFCLRSSFLFSFRKFLLLFSRHRLRISLELRGKTTESIVRYFRTLNWPSHTLLTWGLAISWAPDHCPVPRRGGERKGALLLCISLGPLHPGPSVVQCHDGYTPVTFLLRCREQPLLLQNFKSN